MAAELFPGGPAPGVQPPETDAAASAPNTNPLIRDNMVVPQVAPYSAPQPAAGTIPPFENYLQTIPNDRPNFKNQTPPLGKGFGVDGGRISLPGSTQLPISIAGGQASGTPNLVQLVAFPVLSRIGPQGVSWAAPVPIAGLGLLGVQVRGAYRDLKVTPGWRGFQLQYKTGSITSVIVTENTTGMKYIFGVGTNRALVFAPLFMLREFYDLTFTTVGANFPADATCLLTTEEQLPFQWLS